MLQKRRKLKIQTKNKSYSIQDSIFYKLSNKRRLAKILFTELSALKTLMGDNNYRCFTQVKNGKSRKIQSPLLALDKIHTRVASLICRISPPTFLHSGIRGRSHISNAKCHVGIRRVITVDIRSFFESTTRKNVFDFFYNTMCCSADIADILSFLLTFNGHVPTGSRVSMPLAYYANQKMFLEMLKTANDNVALMTLYVDDLTFSGPSLNGCFANKISNIAIKYGHSLHPNKTRLYGNNVVKLITGAAVDGRRIKVRNMHLKSLHCEMEEWKSKDDKNQRASISNKILGRLNSMSSLDSKYKDRARSFREKAF